MPASGASSSKGHAPGLVQLLNICSCPDPVPISMSSLLAWKVCLPNGFLPPILVKVLPAFIPNFFFYVILGHFLGWSKLFSEVPILFLLAIYSQSCICFEWSSQNQFFPQVLLFRCCFVLHCEDYKLHMSSYELSLILRT